MIASSWTPFKVISGLDALDVNLTPFPRIRCRNPITDFTPIPNKSFTRRSTSYSQTSSIMTQSTGANSGNSIVIAAFKDGIPSLWTVTLLIARHMYSPKTFATPFSEALITVWFTLMVESGLSGEISGISVGKPCVSVGERLFV
jgi:hypothetical protein